MPSNAANEADSPHGDEGLTETDILAKYSDDMAVEDICSVMTPEEASALVIHNGINKGWSMGEIARKRAASLKFYAYLDDECGNVIKAAALTLMDAQPLLKAS